MTPASIADVALPATAQLSHLRRSQGSRSAALASQQAQQRLGTSAKRSADDAEMIADEGRTMARKISGRGLERCCVCGCICRRGRTSTSSTRATVTTPCDFGLFGAAIISGTLALNSQFCGAVHGKADSSNGHALLYGGGPTLQNNADAPCTFPTWNARPVADNSSGTRAVVYCSERNCHATSWQGRGRAVDSKRRKVADGGSTNTHVTMVSIQHDNCVLLELQCP